MWKYPPRRGPRPTVIRSATGTVVFLWTFTGACGSGSAMQGPSELVTALESVPGVAPQLSTIKKHRPCTEQTPPGATIPRATCPALRRAEPERLRRIEARARKAWGDPVALQTRAMIALVRDDPRGIALDTAIALLRSAAGLADDPAPVLGDLAAALLVRAERTQAPRDLLEAYEVAEDALRRQPRNLAALYNHALALDRFGLVDETAAAWRAYLAADSTSRWAGEARRRLGAASAVRAPSPPADGAPLKAYAEYAAADPQGARELGMDLLLGEWGEAVASGNPAKAADRLRQASALGDALERRPDGDASLADAVRAIHAASRDLAATRALATAHHAYAVGRRSYENLAFSEAEPHFAAAAAAAGPSPTLRRWVLFALAVTQIQLGRPEGNVLLRSTVADEARQPALAARLRWARGRAIGRNEGWERALEELRASAGLLHRAGERDEGAALNVVFDIRFVLGEPDSAYAAMHRALALLRRYRTSLRLPNLLLTSARAAASDGLLRSALRIQGEGVGVASRTGLPPITAEARLEHSRLLAATGDLARAGAELRAARTVIRQLDPGARRWFEADLREAEAVVSLRANPNGATQALDSAAQFFLRIPLPFRALPAMVGSAEARLAANDASGAIQRLEAAVRLLDQRRDSIRMEPRRAAVFDAARNVIDRIVLLKLAEGRTVEALSFMDRGRASLAATGRADTDRAGGVAALPGETAVEYARVADTLLVWTVSERGIEVSRTVLDTLLLVRTLNDLERRLERGASGAEVRAGLSRLYEWLIRPVEARLGRHTPLVVVADGEIAAVPFAALFDTRRGRYLVEDHTLRFAASLRESRRRLEAPAADGALLVADPAFDPVEHPVLERLPQAQREVREIRPLYPGATVLQGAAATPAGLESALAGASIFHFAGHAVFDDQRPERSYLVLSRPASRTPGKLTAAELSRLDLRNVRLVVLSACRTVRSGRGRAGGFSGLSGALLAAGAGGAVGSTWDVDDALTSALMAAFHRAYADSGDGPRALRVAQLELLRSPNPALRNPYAWAGFRYAGQ